MRTPLSESRIENQSQIRRGQGSDGQAASDGPSDLAQTFDGWQTVASGDAGSLQAARLSHRELPERRLLRPCVNWGPHATLDFDPIFRTFGGAGVHTPVNTWTTFSTCLT